MLKEVMLLTINSKRTLYSVTADEYSAIQPNICMGLLGAYLKSKGIPVEMYDESYGFTIKELIEIILKYKPLLVGVICSGANPSSSTMSMVGAIEFFREFNKVKKNIKTFICGGHPTVLPERTLRETGADFVILGEGYKSIFNLYNVLSDGISIIELPRKEYSDMLSGVCYFRSNGLFMSTALPELININELPIIDWHLMNPNRYRAHNWHCFGNIENRSPYGVIWTSFGCPYRCDFCCINSLFGAPSYRLRNIGSVIEEIDLLVKKYKVKNIKILDELFIIKNDRIDKFCNALEKRNYDLNIWAYGRMDTINSYLLKRLKKVGMKWMSMGIESVDQGVLDSVDKGNIQMFYDDVINMIRAENINICADIIAGLWIDNYETLQATYDFCVKHNFEWLNIYPAFAYPGTRMYAKYIGKHRIDIPKTWEDYALYGYKCKPVPTKYLSSEQVLQWRDEKFIEYHSRPEYLDMIEKKFGVSTKKHIQEMVKIPLKRKILEK